MTTLLSLFNFLLIAAGLVETTLFQRLELGGNNLCFIDRFKRPSRVWKYVDNLTSISINVEIKKCCFYCLQNPNCNAYQVVRADDGRGFCFIFNNSTTLYIIFIEENTCKSFIKRDKVWDCIIQWDPVNFKTMNNMDGYRVRKMDNSWAIYNNSRGIHILELNATSCLPARLNIFDVANKPQQNRFMNYVDRQAPNGTYMIGYTVGNFYYKGIENYFSQRFGITLHSIYNSSLAFIYLKGGSLGTRHQVAQSGHGFGYLTVITGEKLLPFITLNSFIDKLWFLMSNGIW